MNEDLHLQQNQNQSRTSQSWSSRMADDMSFLTFNAQNTNTLTGSTASNPTVNAKAGATMQSPRNNTNLVADDGLFSGELGKMPTQKQNHTDPKLQQQMPDTDAGQSQLHQRQQQQLFQQLQFQKQRQQQQQPHSFQSRKNSHSSQNSKNLSQGHTPQAAAAENPNHPFTDLSQHQLQLLQQQQQLQQQHAQIQSESQTPVQPQPQNFASKDPVQSAKKNPAGVQLNQHNTEKFLDLVEHYMKRINKPFVRYPVINGLKLNLFIIYYMVTSFGGFIKVYQEQKFPLIANQLGIPSNNQKLLNELLQVYYMNLLPFEQYAKSNDGLRDSQRREQQQQQEAVMNQPQAHLQNPDQQVQQNQIVSQPPLKAGLDADQATKFQQQSFQQEQQKFQQLQLQQKMQEAQKKTLLLQQRQLQSQKQSAQLNKITKAPVNRPRASSGISPHSTTPTGMSDVSTRSAVPKQLTKLTAPPDVIKNYLPYTIIQDKPAGIDILNVERLGEKLDDMKPVFLYFPELGKVDIKALSLSLASGIVAEINVALNILLIISSDPNIQIPFENCMILLDSLAILGKTTVEKLASSNFEFQKPSESPLTQASHSNHVSSSKIDKVFEKYQKKFKSGDYTIEVDSFTSELISSTKPSDAAEINCLETTNDEDGDQKSKDEKGKLDDMFELGQSNGIEAYSSLISKSIDQFKIPDYLQMLHECRTQADDFDFNIYKKSDFDKEIVLIEQLSTISLIFRNLSFSGNNNLVLATCGKYLDYLFTLIYATITKPEIFVFARKRLSLMKDTLVVFSNIIHAVDIRSDMEMWLVLGLVLSFAPNLTKSEKSLNLTTSKFDPLVYRYHPHSIDVLSKVMCGALSNKDKLENLLTGKTNDKSVLKMIQMNFGEDMNETGSLFKHVFSLLISVFPSSQLYQGIELLDENFQSCLQSLLSCLILTETLQSVTSFKENIALSILASEERFGRILHHLSFVYTALYINVPDTAKERHALLSTRCLELANKLTHCAIKYATTNETDNKELLKLKHISKLFGNSDNQIGMLMTINLPESISAQIIDTLNISRKLESLVKD